MNLQKHEQNNSSFGNLLEWEVYAQLLSKYPSKEKGIHIENNRLTKVWGSFDFMFDLVNQQRNNLGKESLTKENWIEALYFNPEDYIWTLRIINNIPSLFAKKAIFEFQNDCLPKLMNFGHYPLLQQEKWCKRLLD